MSKHFRVVTIGALLGLVAATASTSAWVDSGSRSSFVTFSRPVALPGIELRAGTYIFELANPHTNLDLVRVSSRDRSKVYLTAFTDLIDRPEGLPASRIVTLGETPRDGAAPVTAWFPSQSGGGYRFIYR